jgi:CSLREA domain-containing protein
MTRTRRARSSMLRLECLEDRAVPATFNVTTTLDVVDPADGKLSLREAITAANDSDEVDVIVVPAGSYKIALPGAAEDGNATGDFDVTDSVTIRGAGAGLTLLDGQELDRVFDIRGTSPGSIGVILEKLLVRNGKSDDDGGGIHVGNANLAIRDAAIAGNQTLGYGGGISNLNAPGTGNVTLVRATIARNVSSGFGGGVMVSGENSVLAVRNSIVRRNIAFQGGGGVYGDKVTMTNSTISRNYAEFSGGGIYADQLTATHSTFSGNYAGSRGGGIYGGTVVLNFCTVTGNIAESGFPGIAPFRSLTLNSCTVSGNTRSVPPTLIVTTTLDVVDPADGKLSLREAITAANASVFPDTIVLPAGVFRIARSGAGEDGNATGDLDIASRMTIRGAGAGSTLINGGQLDRVFDIHGNSSDSNRVTLEKLQVRNGNAIGHGGGIRVADTFLTVRDAIIAGNQASGNGGGVSDTAVSGSVTLVRTTIARNAAGASGGGINSNSVGMTNSTVSNNSAAVNGGGVYVNFGSVTRSTISNNSASVSGGGVYAAFSIYLTSSTASGNARSEERRVRQE